MCGRGRILIDYQTLECDQIEESSKTVRSVENFAPGGTSNIIVKSGTDTKLVTAKWGLIPSYFKEDITPSSFFRRFNARSENLTKNYQNLLVNNRCVIPFSGFFEWKKEGKRKQAYYVKSKNSDILYMAGIYDEHFDDKSPTESLRTYSIITTDSVSKFKQIHDRVPVVLKENDVSSWIMEKFEVASKLIRDADLLSWHPVSSRVGKLSYQENDCSKEIKLMTMKESMNNMFKNVKPKDLKKPAKRKFMNDDVIVIGDEELEFGVKIDSELVSTKADNLKSETHNYNNLHSDKSKKHKPVKNGTNIITNFFKKKT